MNKKGIIYFSAPWCGPCKQLGPIMDGLEKYGVKVKKVNCDYDASITQQYDIKSIPTLILTDLDGKELSRKIGVQSQQQILDWYNG